MSLPVTTKTNAQNIFRAYADKIRNVDKSSIRISNYIPRPSLEELGKVILYTGSYLSINSSALYVAVVNPKSGEKSWWATWPEVYETANEFPDPNELYEGVVVIAADTNIHYGVVYNESSDENQYENITDRIVIDSWLPDLESADESKWYALTVGGDSWEFVEGKFYECHREKIGFDWEEMPIGSSVQVIDNLYSSSKEAALSARCGKELRNMIQSFIDSIDIAEDNEF